MPWFKRSVLHIQLWAHIKKNDLLYIFAFLKAWTMADRRNGLCEASHLTDKAQGRHGHSTPNGPTRIRAGRMLWPRSSDDEGMALRTRDPTRVYVTLLETLWISFKHQLRLVFLHKLVRLWVLYSAPLIPLFEEGVDFFFKEYGCSKTERIQKWAGALSNALLNVRYKDE